MLNELRNLFIAALVCHKEEDAETLVRKWNEETTHLQEVSDRLIDKACVVNLKPAVRGRWKDTYTISGRIAAEAVCSNCDCFNNWRSDFCPNCGADMRKEAPS